MAGQDSGASRRPRVQHKPLDSETVPPTDTMSSSQRPSSVVNAHDRGNRIWGGSFNADSPMPSPSKPSSSQSQPVVRYPWRPEFIASHLTESSIQSSPMLASSPLVSPFVSDLAQDANSAVEMPSIPLETSSLSHVLQAAEQIPEPLSIQPLNPSSSPPKLTSQKNLGADGASDEPGRPSSRRSFRANNDEFGERSLSQFESDSDDSNEDTSMSKSVGSPKHNDDANDQTEELQDPL
jgi:hypothetical protein